MEYRDDREGMGAITWVAVALLAFALALVMCGCEDDSDTTINEAQDIIVGSNSQVIVVQDNTGIVSVDQTTGGGDPSIFVTGNTGRVFVATRPEEDVPEVEEE